MEYKFKTGVISGITSDEIITVVFEDGTVLTFGKSYWLGLSDPAAGMTVSVMFNRDMGIMGCNEAVATLGQENRDSRAVAGTAENAGFVGNKATSRLEKNTYKDYSIGIEHSVWQFSVQDRDEIREILDSGSIFQMALRPLFKKYATSKGRAPRIEFGLYWIAHVGIILTYAGKLFLKPAL